MKYLHSDREALSEVIRKYANTVTKTYKIQITNVLTVPSLAMKVFRTVFMEALRVQIQYRSGKVDKDIRTGYYGGIVAAIQPKVENGFYYDVNSAYPAAMMEDLPVGNPTRSRIDSRDNIFGFVHAEVTAPEKTVNNVLPRPMRDADGIVRFLFGMVSQG